MTHEADEILSLGMWVRRRRKALDLTQAALAHRVGCAEITIRKIEVDAMRPSPAMVERLVSCLDLPLDERVVLLQIARGEHGAQRLPSPLTGITLPPPDPALGPPAARLPVDTIPDPAPLPPDSRMPLHRNPLFVGRDADLHALVQAFTADETAATRHAKLVAVTGLGGIGKTQLAAEFVHRYGQYFPGGVFWLSFADPAAVPAEVAACGGVDGMQLSPEFSMLPFEEQVRRVLNAWKSPIPRLLIFDNCEEEVLLQQWRPTYGGCRVLVTSRRHHWDAALGAQPVPLDVLPRSESIALLRQFRPDLPANDSDLRAIAVTLGDLPLALHLAGSFLAKYRYTITPAQYLARLHTPTILGDRSLEGAGLSPTEHVQHVARTFAQSYERLDPSDPTDALARTLLAHAACFAPGEPLPRWLVLETLVLPEHDAERMLLAEDALTRLIDLGLLETDAAGSLRLHRLVAAFVQAVLVNAAAQAAVEAMMLRVVNDLNDQGNPRPMLVIQPHLRFIIESALPRADARIARLCHALGSHLWQLAVYPEAERYYAQALTILEQVVGIEHPDTAKSLNCLGTVFWSQGQYAEAQRHYAQALAIYQQVFGADHPDIAMSLNNLGNILVEQGQYAEAQHHYAQALAIRQQVFGANHTSTAGVLKNLGGVLTSLGQYDKAQLYLEQALAIYQQALGPEHPLTAQCFHDLSLVLQAQGQYAEAQRYLEQALAIQQRVFGVDHPDTALSLSNLGVVLQAQGQSTEVQRYVEQALVIQERVLGPDHPDTAKSLHNLGVVFKDLGQYAKAQDYFEQAVAIQQRVLGADHPDTALTLRGLGELLHAHGEDGPARRYLEQALAIFELRLGLDHPDTEQTRWTLATLNASRTTIDPES